MSNSRVSSRTSRKAYRLLIINPGSTSTKIAFYNGSQPQLTRSIPHSRMELDRFKRIWDQYDYRKGLILHELDKANIDLQTLDAVVGRGGFLRPVASGTYLVNQAMVEDLRRTRRGEHASNLGAVLAYGIAWDLNIPAFIVDPVAVDEMDPLARFSGIPEIERESIFHALNIKATARQVARDLHKPLEECNLVVAHLGGGITVCSIRQGRMVDTSNGISEGPMTPERAGNLPTRQLVEMCFSGQYTKEFILDRLVGKGGLSAYLGTNSASLVETRIMDGDQRARLVYEAMAYQVAKEIGAQSTVLKGKADALVLTGGLAHSKMLTTWIRERVESIAPVLIYPGEDEMRALSLGALRVLRGEEVARHYGEAKKTIGVMSWEPLAEYDVAREELEETLRHAGYRFRQPDEDLEILYRHCNRDEGMLRQIIKEFHDPMINLMVTLGSPAAAGVKRMANDVELPVVCLGVFDPVAMGIIKDPLLPGGNLAANAYRINLKDQLEKGLWRILPDARRLGFIYHAGVLHAEIQHDEARALSEHLEFELIDFEAEEEQQLNAAVDFFRRKKVDAVILSSDTTLAEASSRAMTRLVTRFPTLCALASTVHKGGLMAYCADWRKVCRRGAQQVVQVLAGRDPGTLPVEYPPDSGLIINLKTAAAMKIPIPQEILEEAIEIVTQEDSGQEDSGQE